MESCLSRAKMWTGSGKVLTSQDRDLKVRERVCAMTTSRTNGSRPPYSTAIARSCCYSTTIFPDLELAITSTGIKPVGPDHIGKTVSLNDVVPNIDEPK